MSRASTKAAQNQLGITNAAAAGQGGQASAIEGQLLPQYQSMMNEGFSPEALSAMRTSGMGAIAANADAARFGGEERAARTGNAAGVGAEESQLARDSGVAAGNEAAGIEMANEQQRQANRNFALQGEQGLFGTNTSAMESLYGMAPSTINAWTSAAAAPNPWQSTLNAAIGGGAQAGAAALGH